MYIVYGNYIACTDIIAAVIDSVDIDLIIDGLYLHFPDDRKSLIDGTKKTKEELSVILDDLKTKYKSVLSTYSKLKLGSRNKDFAYIYVDISGSQKEYDWFMGRATSLAPDMINPYDIVKKEAAIEHYFADHVIKLEDILEGRLIQKLKEFLPEDVILDERLYKAYLSLLLADFPY